MRFPVTSAMLNTQDKPAIVQEAKKDWRYYESKILASEECTGRLYKEYKEGGAWKEHYKTWEAACVPLGKTRRHVDRLIQEDSEIRTLCPESTNNSDKKEEAALKKVEQSREENPDNPILTKEDIKEIMESEPDEEEKLAVHSADEKVNGKKVNVPRPPIDVSGCVIPQKLLGAVERREEVQEAMKHASALKILFERIQSEPDQLFAHAKSGGSIQTFMTGCASMYVTLRDCLPDVVCPECGGKSSSCHYCCGSGWISEVRWNRDWVKSSDSLKGAEVSKRAAIKKQYGKS